MPETAQFVQESDFEAEYAMESALKCPRCEREISNLYVVRLLRAKVNFTSTLPRKGYVIICPACREILSATLGSI
jgi:hypothetical protein